MSSAEMSTKTTDAPSSGLPALAAAAAPGHRGGLMHLPASPSTPHVPASAAAGEAIAAQCKVDAAAAEYKAAAAEYKANVDEKRENKLRELKDEAYAILQSANEYLLTFRSIPDAVMSSSRKLESHEVTITAGVRKRQKLDFWRGIFELADPKNKNVLLIDGSREATVVHLEDDTPLGQHVFSRRIFVRECYSGIFDKVWNFYQQRQRRITVTLTGTPGIGKSLFGLLFLVELIRFLRSCKASCGNLSGEFGLGLNGRIIYEHISEIGSDATYYLIDTETKAITKQYEKPAEWLDDENVFLIKDGPCRLYDVLCQVLWVSSPRAGSFQKAGELGGNTLVMPPWTPDEIVACWTAGCAPANLFPMPISDKGHLARTAGEEVLSMLDETLSEHAKDEAVLRRWTADLGPVARRVFNPADGYTKLDAALGSDLFKEELCKLAEEATSRDAGGESSRFKTSHRLLLMVPSGDLTTYTFVPSSAKIARTILHKSLQRDLNYAKSLLGKITGANRGLVFEPYAHFMLSTGGTFTIRSLPADGETAESLKLVLPSNMPTVDVDNEGLAALELRDDAYYQPTDPCFAVVDSWTSSVMFQITVGLSHPIKSNSKQFKALQGKGPTRIIFVVPKDIEGRFQRQQLVLADGKPSKGACGPNEGWNDVQQFVLSL